MSRVYPFPDNLKGNGFRHEKLNRGETEGPSISCLTITLMVVFTIDLSIPVLSAPSSNDLFFSEKKWAERFP